jgi:hypothetical protein
MIILRRWEVMYLAGKKFCSSEKRQSNRPTSRSRCIKKRTYVWMI